MPVDAQTEYLQFSEKALTATEMTKLKSGIKVFTETWKSRQGQEWLVWKVVPGNRAERYAEGMSKGSNIDNYEDVAINRVHDLSHIRLQKDNKARNQVAHNGPPQLSSFSFKKRDLMRLNRVNHRFLEWFSGWPSPKDNSRQTPEIPYEKEGLRRGLVGTNGIIGDNRKVEESQNRLLDVSPAIADSL